MSQQEKKDFFTNLYFGCIISADNDEFTEEEKQAIIARYKESKDKENWEYILEPIKDEDKRSLSVGTLNRIKHEYKEG